MHHEQLYRVTEAMALLSLERSVIDEQLRAGRLGSGSATSATSCPAAWSAWLTSAVAVGIS